MKLLTKVLEDQLKRAGLRNAEFMKYEGETLDFMPVVKLFCPWGSATWLLTEIDPENPDIAFGLCDLGMGCPEIGSVSLSELAEIKGPGGLTIERDLYFEPKKTLSGYADEARRIGRINA